MTAQTSTNDMAEALRLALLRADPHLSRFDPLPRIISLDDFSRGHLRLVPARRQLRGRPRRACCRAMRSTPARCSPRSAIGTRAPMAAGFLLRAEDRDTRPQAGAQNVAIKRHTFRKRGPIRFEAYFTFKPEANELKLSETDVRSVGFAVRPAGRRPGRRHRARDAASALPQRRERQACPEVAVQDGDHALQDAAATAEQDRHPLSPVRRKAGATCPTARRGSATTRSRPR